MILLIKSLVAYM
jgi:hypothetical protein